MSRPRTGAVVTGAGRGLGRLIAALLVERGHHVLVTDVSEDAARAAAAELGSDASWAAVDVRDEAQVARARDRVVAEAGRLEVWVNNAGVLVTGPAWEQPSDVRRLMLEVNALGTVNGTVAAIGAMRHTGGHILNVVSLAGLTAVPGEAVYAASKHAAIGFSLSTLADLRLAGIRNVDISCVCPDGIWTPMLHDKLDDPASRCRSPANCSGRRRSSRPSARCWTAPARSRRCRAGGVCRPVWPTPFPRSDCAASRWRSRRAEGCSGGCSRRGPRRRHRGPAVTAAASPHRVSTGQEAGVP
ncbi:SDR family oxidoreductase [Streptomyces coelicoflavus]|uniref:SDR family oxidoreductase n=1 Tax=Streptomyces coelicoflavus TaxID=285562 RepID=UPI0036CC6304